MSYFILIVLLLNVWGTALVHEFHILFSHTEWNLFISLAEICFVLFLYNITASEWWFEINQLLFADDTVLVSNSEEKLYRLLGEFGEVC